MNNTIYIWSNGHPYSNLSEYGDNIGKHDFSNCMNAFMNTCVPLKANSNAFKDARNITFHRECFKHQSESGWFGYSELVNSNWNVAESYVLQNTTTVWKLPTDLKLSAECGSYKKVGELVCMVDNSEYKDKYPSNTMYNETTGFLVYFLMRQLHPESSIVLVNYGVRDARYKVTQQYHGIDFEDKFLTEIGVNRMYV